MRIFVFLFLLTEQSFAKTELFHATQSGNIMQVRSPYGTTLYIGDIGFDRLNHYEIEIPLGDLRTQTSGVFVDSSGRVASGPHGESPDEVSTLIVEANQLYNQGKYQLALKYVDELLQRDPGNVRGWIMKGSLFLVLGEKGLAREAWDKALGLDPKNSQLKNMLKEKL